MFGARFYSQGGFPLLISILCTLNYHGTVHVSVLFRSFLARRQLFCKKLWGVVWQRSLAGAIICVVYEHLCSESGRYSITEKSHATGIPRFTWLFFSFLRCYWQYFVVAFFNFVFFFKGRALVCLTGVFLASSLLNYEIWTQLKSLHSVNLERDEPLWSWWKNSQFDIPGISERLFIYFNSTRISLGVLDNWSVKINFQSFWKINIMIFTQFYSSELSVLQKSVP